MNQKERMLAGLPYKGWLDGLEEERTACKKKIYRYNQIMPGQWAELDEALRELVLLLEDNGFQIAGGAAFAGRHAFSDKVGQGRPDGEDFAQMADFAGKVAEKLAGDALPVLEMDRGEIGPYYTPLKADGTPAKFLKAKPLTDWGKCSRCGACARACPIGSIDRETMEAVGLCVKCQACVRKCTVHAKYFEDGDFLSHVAMLEQNYARRADNQILL